MDFIVRTAGARQNLLILQWDLSPSGLGLHQKAAGQLRSCSSGANVIVRAFRDYHRSGHQTKSISMAGVMLSLAHNISLHSDRGIQRAKQRLYRRQFRCFMLVGGLVSPPSSTKKFSSSAIRSGFHCYRRHRNRRRIHARHAAAANIDRVCCYRPRATLAFVSCMRDYRYRQTPTPPAMLTKSSARLQSEATRDVSWAHI